MCSDDAYFDNRFCDYYNTKIEYQNLDLPTLCKNDILIDANGKKISFNSIIEDKNIHLYFWASWCAPCVHFLNQLDPKKINDSQFSNIYFISIDDNPIAWKERNKELMLPLSKSFLISGGLKSDFAKALKIDHVPFIIDVESNKVKKLNVAKTVLSNFLKN